jgi:hypothetical protein
MMSKTFFFDENAVLAKRLVVIFDQLFLSNFLKGKKQSLQVEFLIKIQGK